MPRTLWWSQQGVPLVMRYPCTCMHSHRGSVWTGPTREVTQVHTGYRTEGGHVYPARFVPCPFPTTSTAHQLAKKLYSSRTAARVTREAGPSRPRSLAALQRNEPCTQRPPTNSSLTPSNNPTTTSQSKRRRSVIERLRRLIVFGRQLQRADTRLPRVVSSHTPHSVPDSRRRTPPPPPRKRPPRALVIENTRPCLASRRPHPPPPTRPHPPS